MRRDLYLARKEIAAESRRLPAHLVRLSDLDVAERTARLVAQGMTPPVEVWRSRTHLVQVFAAPPPAVERLSVIVTVPEAHGWRDGLSWETLQRLKAECGRGDAFAVEVFPPDADVVNVANMRHLWVLPEPLGFAWRAGR